MSEKKNIMYGVLGDQHPRFGKKHLDESRLKISKSNGTAIEVLDLQTEERSNYLSMIKAAEALGCSAAALSKGLKKSNPFVLKERFQIKKIN